MLDIEWRILACLLGVGVSVVSITLILKVHRHFKLTSREELHHNIGKVPVSRLGGIALALAFVSVTLYTYWFEQPLHARTGLGKIMVLSLAMFGIGLWDDLFSLGAKRKLIGQILVASAAYYLGIGIYHFQIPFTGHIIDLGFWSWMVTLFWLVAMTNLINLIDGVDGLAGGICLMLMLLMVYVCGSSNLLSFIALGMAGALLGFLWFNFPPARIYMGDGGAYFLGFLIGSMTIVSSQKGTIFAALIAPLFVLALPILDTTLAIVRRGVQGLPLFRADRSHIHHRLLDTGIPRRKVVLWLYCFTSFFLVLGFTAFWWHGQHFAVLVGIGFLVILLAAGQFNFSREWFIVGRILGNSLAMRAEIQYALAHTRWLALEGSRSKNLAAICEDTVFIARKLGYASVRIRLEDGEKTWQIIPVNEKGCCHFQHKLPGHPYCVMELTAPCPISDAKNEDLSGSRMMNEKSFHILSDLLAEGWAKSISTWKKQHGLPVRFESPEVVSVSNVQIVNPLNALPNET